MTQIVDIAKQSHYIIRYYKVDPASCTGLMGKAKPMAEISTGAASSHDPVCLDKIEKKDKKEKKENKEKKGWHR